ncbi:MAG: hypothetical protein K1X74_01635 [Pirellulales bacterium]|nr:hypothetical protein [Pirellulales bacterium]
MLRSGQLLREEVLCEEVLQEALRPVLRPEGHVRLRPLLQEELLQVVLRARLLCPGL